MLFIVKKFKLKQRIIQQKVSTITNECLEL